MDVEIDVISCEGSVRSSKPRRRIQSTSFYSPVGSLNEPISDVAASHIEHGIRRVDELVRSRAASRAVRTHCETKSLAMRKIRAKRKAFTCEQYFFIVRAASAFLVNR